MPPPGLLELVDRFDRNLEDYCAPRYKETRVRRESVDPFFKRFLLWMWDETFVFESVNKPAKKPPQLQLHAIESCNGVIGVRFIAD